MLELMYRSLTTSNEIKICHRSFFFSTVRSSLSWQNEISLGVNEYVSLHVGVCEYGGKKKEKDGAFQGAR